MIKLSKRLETIKAMVPHSIAADIGADHGKLIMSLYEDGIIPFGYAIENKQGPYNHLVESIKMNGYLDVITPILSDGIRDIPADVDTVIIAGMGGSTIIKILKANSEKLKNVSTIVIDAHSSIPQVREEISKLGFIIADEKIVKEDDVYYEIIKFIKSDIAFYSETELEFGPVLMKEKSMTFKEKYTSRIMEISNLLNSKAIPEARMDELKKEKSKIERIL